MESLLKEVRKEFIGQEVRLSELYSEALKISRKMGGIDPDIEVHEGLCTCSLFVDESTEINVNISYTKIFDEEYFEDFATITEIDAYHV